MQGTTARRLLSLEHVAGHVPVCRALAEGHHSQGDPCVSGRADPHLLAHGLGRARLQPWHADGGGDSGHRQRGGLQVLEGCAIGRGVRWHRGQDSRPCLDAHRPQHEGADRAVGVRDRQREARQVGPTDREQHLGMWQGVTDLLQQCGNQLQPNPNLTALLKQICDPLPHPKVLFAISGSDLAGLPLAVPYADRPVRALVLRTMCVQTGTGVLPSVPADSPADCAALQHLQPAAPMPTATISVPGLEPGPAKALCQEMDISRGHTHARVPLGEEVAFLRGLTDGVMACAMFKGQKAADVGPQMKERLRVKGEALMYTEPKSEVLLPLSQAPLHGVPSGAGFRRPRTATIAPRLVEYQAGSRWCSLGLPTPSLRSAPLDRLARPQRPPGLAATPCLYCTLSLHPWPVWVALS